MFSLLSHTGGFRQGLHNIRIESYILRGRKRKISHGIIYTHFGKESEFIFLGLIVKLQFELFRLLEAVYNRKT